MCLAKFKAEIMLMHKYVISQFPPVSQRALEQNTMVQSDKLVLDY